jgi:hypothetical protein
LLTFALPSSKGLLSQQGGKGKEKKLSRMACQEKKDSYLCTPFRKEVFNARRAAKKIKKKFPETLAERELVLTFAAPFRKEALFANRAAKGRKKKF